jgi:hypothetical protein
MDRDLLAEAQEHANRVAPKSRMGLQTAVFAGMVPGALIGYWAIFFAEYDKDISKIVMALLMSAGSLSLFYYSLNKLRKNMSERDREYERFKAEKDRASRDHIRN